MLSFGFSTVHLRIYVSLASSIPETKVLGSFSSSNTMVAPIGAVSTVHVPTKLGLGGAWAANSVGAPKQMRGWSGPASVVIGVSDETSTDTVDSADGEQAFPPEIAY